MSKRSTTAKRRGRNTVVRSKKAYPTLLHARQSLIDSGIKPHRLDNARHSGTYWKWELSK